MKRPLLFAPLLLAAAIARAGGDAPALPERLAGLLDESGLEYSADDDGEARLLIDMTDGRDQLVWVRTDLTPLGDGRVFHVYSFAHQSAKPVPADRLSRLAEQNVSLILGAWRLRRGDGEGEDGDDWAWRVVFTAELPDSVDAGQFKTAVITVAATADELEKDWTDTDRF